ncbi:MAG: hypothetical protein D6685_15775 [Bacteroidetes bacterium]|nr:MAG: hypothetical protein D6685_15775 [Bacteroidota bacterium]
MQKIITTYIDPMHGDTAMQQIMDAAGEGTWRIVSLLDLSRIQEARQHTPGNPDPHPGDLVLVVLEDDRTR